MPRTIALPRRKARTCTTIAVHRLDELPGVTLSAVDLVGVAPPRVSLDFTVALNLGRAHLYLARGSRWMAERGALIVSEPGDVGAAEPCAERIRVDVLFVGAHAVTDLEVPLPWREGTFRRAPIVLDNELRRCFISLATSLQEQAPGALEAEEGLFSFVAAMRRARGAGGGFETHRGNGDRRAVRRVPASMRSAIRSARRRSPVWTPDARP